MKGLIERLFDYERVVALVESEIFSQPDRMDVVFNYIDLSFQLFPTSSIKHTESMLNIFTHSGDTMTKKQVLTRTTVSQLSMFLDIASEKIPIWPNIWTNKLKVLTETRTWKELKLILLLCHNRHRWKWIPSLI